MQGGVPDFSQTHAHLLGLADASKYHQAIAEMKELLQKDTFCQENERYYLLSLLGYACHQIADYEAAVPHLEQALGKMDVEYYPNYFLARSLLALGRMSEAVGRFIRAAELSGGNPDLTATVVPPALTLTLELEGIDAATRLFERLQAQLGASENLEVEWQKMLLTAGRLEQLEALRAISSTPEERRPLLLRIRSMADWARSSGGEVIELGEPEVVPLEPLTATPLLSNAPYVARLSDVTLIGGCSLIVTPDGSVLSDLLTDSRYGRYVSMQYDKQVLAQHVDALLVRGGVTIRTLDRGVMLCGLASEAYGHWIAEFLPRLEQLERHPMYEGCPIIVDEGMPASHLELLGLLTSNPIHVLPRGERVKIGQLLVAPTPTFHPVEVTAGHPIPIPHICALSPRGLRFLRDRVLQQVGAEPCAGERIFLSRAQMRWRRVANEKELIEICRAHGYQSVFIEDLGVRDQVRLFQRASSIIAPNGSALLSLVFSEPSVRVLILAQQDSFTMAGWLGPMSRLGYGVSLVVGPLVGGDMGKHTDYRIDATRFSEALQAMHAPPSPSFLVS